MTNPDRPYGEALRRLGIKNPGEVQVSQIVQPVVLMDEPRDCISPLDRVVCFSTESESPPAGDYASFQLIPGGEGIWLLQGTSSAGALCAYWIDTTRTAGYAAAPTNLLRFGRRDCETVFESGTPTGATRPVGAYLARSFDLIEQNYLYGLFIPRGRVFHMEHVVAATSMRAHVAFWEIPRQGVVTDE